MVKRKYEAFNLFESIVVSGEVKLVKAQSGHLSACFFRKLIASRRNVCWLTTLHKI